MARLIYSVIALSLLTAQALADTSPESIRGHAWGGPLGDLGDSILGEDDGDLKCYQKKNDDLTVGAATLGRADYCYYKDRLASVFLKYKGYANFNGLKSTLFQKYGAGNQPNQFMEKYQWTLSSVFIDFEYHQIGDAGELMYMYVPLMKEQQRDTEEQQKKGADKL